jgi:hypothetical protein
MELNVWHKATKSDSNGGCVEVMETEDGFCVRDTKDAGQGPVLLFTHKEWDAFIDGMAKGEFNPSN